MTRQSITDALLDNLNATKGLTYPQVGYSYFADVKGDGRNIRSVYTIVNHAGGVTYSTLNGRTSRARCQNIRAAIQSASPVA